MNYKLITRSLSKPMLPVIRETPPASCQVSPSRKNIENQCPNLGQASGKVNRNYTDLSKSNLVRLLQQSSSRTQEYRRDSESLHLALDRQTVHNMELNASLTRITLELETKCREVEEVRSYCQLLDQKYRGQVQSLELRLAAFQPDKDHEILRLKQQNDQQHQMYRQKLQRLVCQFQVHKSAKTSRQDSQHRRLLQVQMLKSGQLETRLQAVTQEYVGKQQQLDTATQNIQRLWRDVEILSETNQLLLSDIHQVRSQKDSGSQLSEIQKLNDVLKASFEKKIELLQKTFKEEQIRFQREKANSSRFREESKMLRSQQQQLQARVQLTQNKYVEMCVSYDSVQKQFASLKLEAKERQLQNCTTQATLKNYFTQKSCRSSKFHRVRSKLAVVGKQVAETKQRMSQLKQQLEYSLQVRREEIGRCLKDCESMVAFSMNIKEDRIKKLSEENTLVFQQVRALTEREVCSNEKDQQIDRLNQELVRLGQKISVLDERDIQKRSLIRQMKSELKVRDKKSLSTIQSSDDQRYQKSQRLLGDLYQDIENQKTKLLTTREHMRLLR